MKQIEIVLLDVIRDDVTRRPTRLPRLSLSFSLVLSFITLRYNDHDTMVDFTTCTKALPLSHKIVQHKTCHRLGRA